MASAQNWEDDPSVQGRLTVIQTARALAMVPADAPYVLNTGFQEWARPPLYTVEHRLVVCIAPGSIGAMRRRHESEHIHDDVKTNDRSQLCLVPPHGVSVTGWPKLDASDPDPAIDPDLVLGVWDPILGAIVTTVARYNGRSKHLQFMVPREVHDRLVVVL